MFKCSNVQGEELIQFDGPVWFHHASLLACSVLFSICSGFSRSSPSSLPLSLLFSRISVTVFKSFYADVWNSGLSEHPRLGRAAPGAGRPGRGRATPTRRCVCRRRSGLSGLVWSGVAVANERDGTPEGGRAAESMMRVANIVRPAGRPRVRLSMRPAPSGLHFFQLPHKLCKLRDSDVIASPTS